MELDLRIKVGRGEVRSKKWEVRSGKGEAGKWDDRRRVSEVGCMHFYRLNSSFQQYLRNLASKQYPKNRKPAINRNPV